MNLRTFCPLLLKKLAHLKRIEFGVIVKEKINASEASRGVLAILQHAYENHNFHIPISFFETFGSKLLKIKEFTSHTAPTNGEPAKDESYMLLQLSIKKETQVTGSISSLPDGSHNLENCVVQDDPDLQDSQVSILRVSPDSRFEKLGKLRLEDSRRLVDEIPRLQYYWYLVEDLESKTDVLVCCVDASMSIDEHSSGITVMENREDGRLILGGLISKRLMPGTTSTLHREMESIASLLVTLIGKGYTDFKIILSNDNKNAVEILNDTEDSLEGITLELYKHIEYLKSQFKKDVVILYLKRFDHAVDWMSKCDHTKKRTKVWKNYVSSLDSELKKLPLRSTEWQENEMSRPKSIKDLQRLFSVFLDTRRRSRAASCCEEIAQLYETGEDLESAICWYQKAIDHYLQISSMNRCRLKIAICFAQQMRYTKAIKIYEEVATMASINEMKDHLFDAGICHLCVGDIASTRVALENYQDKHPTFRGTREYEVICDLATAIEEKDVGKFTAVLEKFEQMSPLDAWKTVLFERMKDELMNQDDNFGGNMEDTYLSDDEFW